MMPDNNLGILNFEYNMEVKPPTKNPINKVKIIDIYMFAVVNKK